jgi:hypothetical protein
VDINLSFSYNGEEFSLQDKIYIDDNQIIICDKFSRINIDEFSKKPIDLNYDLKIHAIVVFALVLASNNNMSVFVREIINSGDYLDYKVEFLDKSIVNKVIDFYIESYQKPTLIHKKAIEAYAKHVFDGEVRAYQESKKTYVNGYQNSGLDKIKEDFIWSTIAEEYFEFVETQQISNDIIFLGDILSRVLFIPNRLTENGVTI